jgi:sec-independent protein translocase protein TatB
MFNIGASELVLILVFALLVLGPKRLPELARGLGKFLREMRRQTDEVRTVVEREFYRMDQSDLPRPTSMPAPKPAARPLSFPYRGPETRPSLAERALNQPSLATSTLPQAQPIDPPVVASAQVPPATAPSGSPAPVEAPLSTPESGTSDEH